MGDRCARRSPIGFWSRSPVSRSWAPARSASWARLPSRPGSRCSSHSGSSSCWRTTWSWVWGGFPVLCGYAAVAGDVRGVTVLAVVFAVLLSLAQRVLSHHVRYVRRRVIAVRGELELADASKEPLDARRLTAPAETGLRLLSLATV